MPYSLKLNKFAIKRTVLLCDVPFAAAFSLWFYFGNEALPFSLKLIKRTVLLCVVPFAATFILWFYLGKEVLHYSLKLNKFAIKRTVLLCDVPFAAAFILWFYFGNEDLPYSLKLNKFALKRTVLLCEVPFAATLKHFPALPTQNCHKRNLGISCRQGLQSVRHQHNCQMQTRVWSVLSKRNIIIREKMNKPTAGTIRVNFFCAVNTLIMFAK